MPAPELALPDLVVTALDAGEPTVRIDLEVTWWQEDGTLHGRFLYDRELSDATTITRLAARLRTVLEAIGRDSARPLAALPLLAPAERPDIGRLGWTWVTGTYWHAFWLYAGLGSRARCAAMRARPWNPSDLSRPRHWRSIPSMRMCLTVQPPTLSPSAMMRCSP